MSLEYLALILSSLSFVMVGVTVFLYLRLQSHYNNLTGKINGKNLKNVLEDMLRQANSSKKDIDFLKKYCDTIQKEGQFHIQKVGLLRFNPFKDTGGDQSFILSLVDGQNSGVIISGLYSRSGTRWYAKKIKGGKGVEHELSDEEKQALKETA